jgi:hypothetical protein
MLNDGQNDIFFAYFPSENAHPILICNRKMMPEASFSIADTHWVAFFYYGNEIAVIRNTTQCLGHRLQPKAES